MKSVTFGSLAKMPRDWTRFEEWQSTTHMTAHELRKLPERFAVPEPEPEASGSGNGSERACPAKGSVSGKLVDPDHVRKLEPLARELLAWDRRRSGRSSRAVVVAEDVQMTLAIIRASPAPERRRVDAAEADLGDLGCCLQGGGHDPGVLLPPFRRHPQHAGGLGVPGVGGLDLSLRQGVPVEGEREVDGDDGGCVELGNATTPSHPDHR